MLTQRLKVLPEDKDFKNRIRANDDDPDIRNIEEETKANFYFRKVLYTGKHLQLVVMSLKPGEEIGIEIHPGTDQFFRVDAGEGKIVTDEGEGKIRDGFSVIVPAGTKHNIINTGDTDLKLYTLYAPPEHKDGEIQRKADREEKENDNQSE